MTDWAKVAIIAAICVYIFSLARRQGMGELGVEVDRCTTG